MILKCTPLLLMFFILLPAFPAYALDNNYVISEYNGWIDIDDRIDYERSRMGFDGFLKKIVDEENGCFYIYFSFYDVRLNGFDDENIVISFDVSNDINSYSFSVNKNGFIDTGADDQRNIRLVYNFDNCSINGCGGEIMIGFELANQMDRQLYNSISCEYAGGISKTALLFENQCLDMYVEPTEKESTSNAVKITKPVKSSAQNTKADNMTKEKTESDKKNNVTKYTPTGTVKSNAKNEKTTKFSGNRVYLQSSEAVQNEGEKETAEVNSSDTVNGSYHMSKTAIIVMAAAITMVVVGVVLTVLGVVIKRKNKMAEEAVDNEST